MTITVSGTSITFNDATVQTTASTSVGGITTVTLSTASPSATLTSSSNQYIRVVLDTTTPYAPSIVMPDMTTLTTGQGRFVVSNELGIPLAIKDNGGTIREFLPSGNKYSLNITSTATANGVWYFNNTPTLVGDAIQNATFISRSSYMSNTAASFNGGPYIVTLDSTNFALAWVESAATTTAYVRLFTVNTSTGAFTVGNRITLGTSVSMSQFAWDSDNAGHALIMYVDSLNTGFRTVGLSVSGGTLYASSVLSVAAAGTFSSLMVAYLGSNNAYAYAIRDSSSCACVPSCTVRGCTVTGTTSVTMTQSASNFGTNTELNYVRTGLTTFIAAGQWISYNPAANTFTRGTRTTQTQAEQWTASSQASFGQSGWMYCNGKCLSGNTLFDVTNATSSSVTVNLASSYSAKPFISTNYVSYSNAPSYIITGQAIYISSSKILGVTFVYGQSSGRLFQSDPSTSTFNYQSSGQPYSQYANNLSGMGVVYDQGILLSANNAIAARSYGIGTGSILLQYVPIATSIV